jgi:AcrR family transcriptional regulator
MSFTEPPIPDHPRDRMLRSAALLLREHGVEGTSFSQVLAHSGAPRGSIYHYFPGGKAQMIEEATRLAGDFIGQMIVAPLQSDDPLIMLDGTRAFWADVLGRSEFRSGCPIVASTLDGENSPEARDAAADVFAGWEKQLADALRRHGVEDRKAAGLATMTWAGIEGAVIIARAQRSMDPLDRVLDQLRDLLASALRDARLNAG